MDSAKAALWKMPGNRQQGGQAAGEGGQAAGEGGQAAGEGVQAAGEGVQAAGEGVQAAGEGVQAASEGVQATGEGGQAAGAGVQATCEGVQARQNMRSSAQHTTLTWSTSPLEVPHTTCSPLPASAVHLASGGAPSCIRRSSSSLLGCVSLRSVSLVQPAKSQVRNVPSLEAVSSC